MNSTKEISEYARFLRNASPEQYANFVAALAEYTQQSINIMLHTTENWQLAQGHAQQCLKILRALEEVK